MRKLLAVVLCLLAGLAAVPAPAAAQQVALVIGNTRYSHLPALKNPKRDAAAIADRLRDLKFDVQEVFDGDTFSLERAAERFLAAARGADLALFYFAGHGVQLFDRNVLLASDADPRTADRIEALGLDLPAFLGRLRAAGAVRTAVLIDACRDNPMAFEETVALLRRVAPAANGDAGTATRSIRQRGLARSDLPPAGGTGSAQSLLFFAAQPNNVSFDGDGLNSYFVEGLKEALGRADRPLSELLQQASAYVRTVTGGRQVPQVVSDWTSDVVLGRSETAKVRYLNVSSDGGKPLTDAQMREIGEGQRSYAALHGTFIVHERQSFEQEWTLEDKDRYERSKKIGRANGFAIDYDLDRDGRPETLGVYVRQVNVIFAVIKEGVTAYTTPCYDFDNEPVETVEIALRDMNGDRRPEILLHMKTKDAVWGTFCILEFAGIGDVAQSRRGGSGERFDHDGKTFRVLLRQSTASVKIGEDNSIETCDGSNCHTRSIIRFDGERFRMTLDESDPPSRVRALPFRDEAERRRLGAVERTASADTGGTRGTDATPQAGPGDGDRAVAEFVEGTYLADGKNGTVTARFADVVQYYGKPRKRADILTEKRAYFARWVSRRYDLDRKTLKVTPGQRGAQDVSFEYDFALRRADGTQSQGRGRTRLTLTRDARGFVIAREEGEVVSRR